MREVLMIFEFEREFSGSLRCLPMIARQKLDIVGIKMTLRQWSHLSHEERARLTDMSCDSDHEQEAYHTLVMDLIRSWAAEPVRYLDTRGLEDWQEANRVPAAVLRQAAADGVRPPTPQEWGALMPLQRFALIKLARSQHENENFVPALKEFGILSSE